MNKEKLTETLGQIEEIKQDRTNMLSVYCKLVNSIRIPYVSPYDIDEKKIELCAEKIMNVNDQTYILKDFYTYLYRMLDKIDNVEQKINELKADEELLEMSNEMARQIESATAKENE